MTDFSTLTVGKDTYCSIDEADEYVGKTYNRYAPLRVIWSVLDDEEKASYLRTSLTEIENLLFTGKKYDSRQLLAFPRIPSGNSAVYSSLPLGMRLVSHDYSEIPQAVKAAQTENALAIICKECMAQTDKQFMIMQSLGLMKNIKYNKREAGDVGMGDDITGVKQQVSKLTSKTAEKLLRPWLGGLRV